MVVPVPPILVDLSLLFLRWMMAAMFGASGWSHVRNPEERGEGLGLSPGATCSLGVVELAGAALLVVGLFDQIAAGVLVLVMLGAIQRKIFTWEMTFWGEEGSNGWYYELLYIVCNLVIFATGGGALGLDMLWT